MAEPLSMVPVCAWPTSRGLDKQGKTAREILASYPDLALSQVHAALLYFYEHAAEIEAELAEDERWHENHARAKAGCLTKHGLR